MACRHHPRGPVEHCAEVVVSTQFGLTGGDAHAHRQFQRPLRGDGGVDGGARRSECRAHTVTGVLEHQPSCVSTVSRSTWSCASSAARIASASASQRRVEPSISVNRKVTTPDGAAMFIGAPRTPASPEMSSYVRQRGPTWVSYPLDTRQVLAS